MRRVVWVMVTVLVALASIASVAADKIDALAQARDLYNHARYDEAIDLARTARQTPAQSNGASLVLARAYLEKYRGTSDVVFLGLARDALKATDAAPLTAADRTELLIGMAESQYFEDRFGVAAEMFNVALTDAGAGALTSRDRVLEWWATSVDRQAQTGADAERKIAYGELLDRMDAEIRLHPDSATAAYWLPAAARGTDDLERAWNAALAGWIRAPLCGSPDVVETLRADLDRLVVDGIIPERARRLAARSDVHAAVAAYTAQWDAMKDQWK